MRQQLLDPPPENLDVASTDLALLDHRIAAAHASGGTSDGFIYRMIARSIRNNDLRGSVLDFGAGKGDLTRLLLEAGRFSQVAAADLMESPADLKPSVRWMVADLNHPLPCASESFDVIVAAEVIEHLENPRSVSRELFRLLRPGGSLILTTPNNESWRALISLIVRGHFVAFNDGSYPAHITALLRTDLLRILTEVGFAAPAFDYSHHGGVPGLPIVAWQSFSMGILRGLRFSDNLLALARKPRREGVVSR
ncbi:MAG TPA: methyltransferase domain-containing protein [Terriglobales bacterium]|nr:methyltransferase domain-containing protein [Terriglobales bacterium]